jgi:hypothetical protein
MAFTHNILSHFMRVAVQSNLSGQEPDRFLLAVDALFNHFDLIHFSNNPQ